MLRTSSSGYSFLSVLLVVCVLSVVKFRVHKSVCNCSLLSWPLYFFALKLSLPRRIFI